MNNTQKLNILQITGSFPPMPCGVGDNTLELVKRFAEKGHRVSVVTSKKASSDSPHSNVSVYPVMPGWSVFFAGTLLKKIMGINPDIIHLQYPTKGYGKGFAPSIIGMQMKSKKMNIPYVVTLHEFAHANPLRKAAIMPLLSESSMTLFPSVQEKVALHRRFDTLKKIPSRIIPIGPVLPDNYNELLHELEMNKAKLMNKWQVPEDGVVVNYGFLHPHKGFEYLLKAFKKICESDYKCELWHIGAFDPHRRSYDRFIKYISNEGVLKDRVKFLGFLSLEESAEIFSFARVGVFPFKDGFSDRRSSMITFGFFNSPMITTLSTSGEVNERIKHSVTLVEPGNSDQLHEKMEGIIANDALYKNACENSRSFRDYYNWDLIADKTLKVYCDLLSDRPIGMPYKVHTESEILAEQAKDSTKTEQAEDSSD